jgi:2-polyprenyl-3-methyl-5-hydroxy-6-metoxy-1,4-benzoquinol methylase
VPSVRPHPSTDLSEKAPGYYSVERTNLVDRLPRPIGSALDIGCGTGGVGTLLRAAGARRLVGIEIVEEAAEVARSVYDEVLVGEASECLADLGETFDTIVSYDVLEHVYDPWATLRAARAAASPGATLHVSVPNARHFSLVRDLALRGSFGYTNWGHRDNTHIRWFTRRDIVAAVSDAGFSVVEAVPSPLPGPLARAPRLVEEFAALQWYVLARAPSS